MFEKLSLFQMSGRMASHAALRQRLVAENIANANTPGYRQQDIPLFSETLREGRTALTLRASRPGHRGADHDRDLPTPRIVRDAHAAPNGNTVSLETEVMKTAHVRHQHDTALAVYRSTMSILRTVLAERGA